MTASAATAALHGMGGVGKTQLALKYSHDFRDEYAGVWWFRAEDLGRLQQDCQQFCERCGVQVSTGEEHHQAVKRWLQGQPRWLLVYDNAEAQYGEQKESLHPFLPGGDHHVLITARNNCWDGLAKPIELDVWDEEQALEFLRKRLERATDEELRTLCRALGGLPLALEQACAYIVKVGVPVDGYCRALADWEKGEKLLDRKDSLATGYSHSVLATLSLAFGRLSEGARELLRLCAWCAAEPIPESLFRGGERFLPATLGGIVADELLWREVVAELSGYALVQVVKLDMTPNGAKDSVIQSALLFHRLTQEAIRIRISSPEADCAIIADILHDLYPIEAHNPIHWPLCHILMPHALGMEAFCERAKVDAKPICWLITQVASYLRYGPTLLSEACDLFRRALAITRNVHGEEHRNTLVSMSNLAGALHAYGNYMEALKLQREVVKISQQILPENNPVYTFYLNNLSETLRVQGNYAEARLLQERVLKIRRDIWGDKHTDTITSMNNLALILFYEKEFSKAQELQENAYEIATNLMGEEHLDTLSMMMNLAETRLACEDYSNARVLQQKAFDVCLRKLGEEHSLTLRAMNNLARTLGEMGEFASGQKLLRKALDICSVKFAKDHPNTSVCAYNLFRSLRDSGEHQKASVIFETKLAWLLECDPKILAADQQKIRINLLKYL